MNKTEFDKVNPTNTDYLMGKYFAVENVDVPVGDKNCRFAMISAAFDKARLLNMRRT